MTARTLIAQGEESIVASLEFLMRDAVFETLVLPGRNLVARVRQLLADPVRR